MTASNNLLHLPDSPPPQPCPLGSPARPSYISCCKPFCGWCLLAFFLGHLSPLSSPFPLMELRHGGKTQFSSPVLTLTLALDFVSTMVSWPRLRGLPAGTVSPTRAKAELVRAVATPAPLRRSPPPGQALHWDPPTRPLLMSINTGLPLRACPSPPLPNASNICPTQRRSSPLPSVRGEPSWLPP